MNRSKWAVDHGNARLRMAKHVAKRLDVRQSVAHIPRSPDPELFLCSLCYPFRTINPRSFPC